MDDRFNDLPDWDDERFNSEEDGEVWKPNPTRDACKALFKKWQEVVFMLKGIISPLLERADETLPVSIAQIMYGEAHMVAAKILGSEAAGIYVVRMENAAIIRQQAQSIASSLLLLMDEEDVDEDHVAVVRDEITAFRMLFIAWVRTFEKDEFVVHWGLFA